MFLALKARALGIRVVERTDDHIVVKMPRWFGGDIKRDVAHRLAADAITLGQPVRIMVGDRLVRVERIHSHGKGGDAQWRPSVPSPLA